MASSGMINYISITLLTIAAVMCDAGGSSSVDFVKNSVSSHSIVMFSKSYCPFCATAKDVFKELNEEPYVIELDKREDGSKIQDAMSQIVHRRTVPQVFINGKHIGGSDDTVEAYRTGELAKLLNVDSRAKDEF